MKIQVRQESSLFPSLLSWWQQRDTFLHLLPAVWNLHLQFFSRISCGRKSGRALVKGFTGKWWKVMWERPWKHFATFSWNTFGVWCGNKELIPLQFIHLPYNSSAPNCALILMRKRVQRVSSVKQGKPHSRSLALLTECRIQPNIMINMAILILICVSQKRNP